MTPDRTRSLGSSEIAAVAGLHPYASALDVWASKVGMAEDHADPRTEVGKALERPVLALYGVRRGYRVTPAGPARPGPESWITATPDAIVDMPGALPRPGAVHIAECKIVGYSQRHRWFDEADGPAGVPVEVLCQVQWQMMVVGVPRTDVVALHGTDLRVYEVPRDDRMIDLLVTLGRAFWHEHVEPRKMPTPDGSERARRVLLRAYPKMRAGMLPMREDVAALARQHADASEALARVKALRDGTANRLCAAIGDALGFDSPDLCVTWRPTRGRVDWEAVARAKGATDADAEACRASGTRRLHVGTPGDDGGEE